MNIDIVDLSKSKEWLTRFEEYRETILNSNDKNRQNYSRESFDLNQQLITYLVINKDENEIISFSSAFHPAHWPAGIVRISNRTYIDPKYRSKGLSRDFIKGGLWGQRYVWDTMIPILKTEYDTNTVVVSRFNTGSKNCINLSLSMAQNYDTNFRLDDRYFLTFNNPSDRHCWQRIVYLHLISNHNNSLNNIPNITQSEYAKRFTKLCTIPVM